VPLGVPIGKRALSIPHTYKNRFGVYYFRLVFTKSGYRSEIRLSLKTKDAGIAKVRAMKAWLVANDNFSHGCWDVNFIKQRLLCSFEQMHNGVMPSQDTDMLGPELISLVDIAGTRDLEALQDIVALAHGSGGNIHAPFGAGECSFWQIHDEEYEEAPTLPSDVYYFVSSTAVLTEASIEKAISTPNGYFEYTDFYSFAPGGWRKNVGFRYRITAPKPVGVKVIQLKLEREFAKTLVLPPSSKFTTPPSEFGLLSKEFERFCKEKVRADDWSNGTLRNYQSIFGTFIEIVGDKPISEVSRHDVHDYLDIIDTLPTNRNKDKRFRDLSARDASNRNAQIGGKSLSKKTKNNYIRRLSEPFDELVEAGIFSYNFFRNARGYSVTEEEELDARHPWTPDELKTIFESRESIRRLSKEKHKPSRPWALLICLFTGARAGEILSLPLDGIRWEGDTPYFNIINRPGHNRLKTTASARGIPVHPKLVELGLINYLKRAEFAQKKADTPMLFPDVTYTQKNGWGRNTSRWYNETLFPKIGVKDPKKVFHSFRHNLSDIFRRTNGVNQLKVSAYLGHKDKSNKAQWQKGYGSPFSPSELLEVTKYIDFDLDFSVLKKECLDKITLRPIRARN